MVSGAVRLLLISLLLCMGSGAALAQTCNGQFAAGTLCANPNAIKGQPSATPNPVLGNPGVTAGSLAFANTVSGTLTIKAASGALGTSQITIPAVTGTLITSADVQTVTNTMLANSTISGIALGSNLASLTATDGSLTFSAAYNGGTARTVGCTTATSVQKGCVEPDGTIITVTAGVITVPQASTSVFGVVKVDGSTITASGGVITAVGGAVSSVTGTAGQITASPTTGAVVVSLPATITANETFSGTVNFSGTFKIGGTTVSLPISLTNGGTNASLVASNGGIVYSTASAFAILSGTVTAGQCLLSGSSAAPTWGSCAGGAAVSSVINSDGTLTISPTTGAVVASIALAHPNSWTGAQTFATSDLIINGGTATAGIATVNASGVVSSSTFASACTAATISALGCVEGDNATLSLSVGVISIALGHANTWSGAQTFATSDLIINGGTATAGVATVNASGVVSSSTFASACTAATISVLGCVEGDNATLSISAGVISIALNHANTWSGIQTFNSGQLKLAGSGSGNSILNAPATGGGTATLFAGTDTVAGLSLANGGTNAALTASNGGIVYSGASGLAILAGTVTANQCLLSGSSTTPSWGSCGNSALHESLFTSTGSGTFTPTVTTLYKVTITAGGGQGGVGTGSPGGGGGGGGGAGATCYYYATLTASTPYTLTVGASAANSTFVNGATTVTASHGSTGASAGGNGTGASGGATGTCTNATFGPVAGGDGASGGSGDLDLTGTSTGAGGSGGGGGGAGGSGGGGNASNGPVFGSGGGGSGGNGGTIGSGKQGAVLIEGVF